MPSLLTTTEIREHVDTDLSEAALQRLIDAAEDEITQRYGAHAEAGTVEEQFYPSAGENFLFPSRKVNTAVAVVITRQLEGESTATTAAASEYVFDDPHRIRLLAEDVWADHVVTVTYTPVTDGDRRKGVLIDLVKLACRYEALSSSRMGDMSVNHVEYERERGAILGRLSTFLGSFA
jgi:hypothetical protein